MTQTGGRLSGAHWQAFKKRSRDVIHEITPQVGHGVKLGLFEPISWF